MKKFTKILFAVLTAFTICITSVSMTSAVSKQEQAKSRYAKVLSGKSGFYEMVDMNGDKVNNLLLKDMGNKCFKVYNYKKCLKTLKCPYGGKMYYNKSKHIVIMEKFRKNVSGSETYVYKVGGNSVKQIKTLSSQFGTKGKKSIYKINGKTVSAKAYNQSLAKVKSGCKQPSKQVKKFK